MTQLPDVPALPATLRVVRVVAPLGALVMTVAVVVGLAQAPEGAAAELLINVWGRVTIVDLYLALLAGWLWIAWRERRAATAALWGALLIITGSVALWVYVTLCAARARDIPELLLGPQDIGD